MTRLRRLWAALVLATVLGGCWDRSQLEDQFYVIKLGLDRRDDGQLLVSAQIAITPKLSTGVLRGSAESSSPTAPCHTLTTVGGSITQAIHMLNGSLTRSLSLIHLRSVIIGEGLAREGVEPRFMELWRHMMVRATPLVAQARGATAYDVLQECRPLSEVNIARVPEGFLLQQKRYHLAPPVRMQHFMIRLGASGGDPFLPAVGINPGIGGAPADLANGRQSALAGELPRLGGNAIEFVGTAIFKHDRLQGYLNVDETQMLLALRGEMGKAYISLPDPDQPEQQVAMRFQQENMPKYQAHFEGGKPRVSVRLLFEGELLAIPGGADYVPAENRMRLETAAAREAERTLRALLEKLNEWKADPVGFGLLFRNRFADWDDWLAYDWDQRLADLQVDVSAEMRIRRYGLYTGPDRVRGGR